MLTPFCDGQPMPIAARSHDTSVYNAGEGYASEWKTASEDGGPKHGRPVNVTREQLGWYIRNCALALLIHCSHLPRLL
jgi:hypothetical protein